MTYVLTCGYGHYPDLDFWNNVQTVIIFTKLNLNYMEIIETNYKQFDTNLVSAYEIVWFFLINWEKNFNSHIF